MGGGKRDHNQMKQNVAPRPGSKYGVAVKGTLENFEYGWVLGGTEELSLIFLTVIITMC